MSGIAWLEEPPAAACAGAAPLVWYVRLDQARAEAWASRSALSRDDLAELAGRPQAAVRGLRRRLAKALVAAAAAVHPDRVALRHTDRGAPVVASPQGWHVSLAGQWPHCLLGVSRRPLGVDIEPAARPDVPLDALTPREREDAAMRSDPHLRLSAWVVKEAHAKLFGRADRSDPAAIETWRDGAAWRAASPDGRSTCRVRQAEATLQCAAWEQDAGGL